MIQELLSNTIYLPPYRIKNFDPIKKADAEAFSNEVELEYIASGGFTQDEIIELNIYNGYWSEDQERELEKVLKEIQHAKLMYFEDFFMSSKRERHAKAIANGVRMVNKLILAKNHLYEFSSEYVKEEAYWLFLFTGMGSPSALYKKYSSWRMNDDTIRSLYFEHKWRTLWAVSKDPYSLFGIRSNELNDNQISLLYWSKIYDNIQEAQDPPPQVMMTDHIAIDGWFIKQSKTKEGDRRFEDKKASEIFVMARNKQEVAEITSLNSLEGQRVIKSRAKDIKEKGDLDEFNFSHVKQDLAMKFNELNSRGK